MTRHDRDERVIGTGRVISLISGITLSSVVGCGGGPTDTAETTSVSEALGASSNAIAQVLVETDVVADEAADGAVGGPKIDPLLVNAWGIAFSPSGRPWVSDNEKGVTTVYDSTGVQQLVVTIPPPKGQEGPSAPTGQVFNADGTAFDGDKFIFATEDGTISGWQGGMTATLRADESKRNAVYKGVAIAKAGNEFRLYATDFHNARMAVFDDAYHPRRMHGRFVDPFLPPLYAPFNVVEHDGRLYVSYAKQKLPEKKDDDAGAGRGFVDVFDPEGHLLQRLISRGALNSPWGMAFAPADYGAISGRLLVGNFGDGGIHAYELEKRGPFLRAKFEGAIGKSATEPLTIDGLWALVFAPDADNVNSKQLWFSAGPDDESHGLFGRLDLP